MKNLYTLLAVMLSFFHAPSLFAQLCSNLAVNSAIPTESRCMATGTITVSVSGGSGNYNYRVTGPVNTPYTSSPFITGLPAGTYSIVVQDVTTGCIVERPSVTVTGTYVDPRFTVVKTDETCKDKTDGTITLSSLTGGRAPYTFTIVTPSPTHVGVSNTTGSFTGLRNGEYSIELKDSCGGIQTRKVTILAYNWWIESHSGQRSGCQEGDFSIRLKDSRGNDNNGGTTFSAFQYGVVNSAGDTSWYSTRDFQHNIGTRRILTLVAKDDCGNVRSVNWTDTAPPTVANLVATSSQSCNSFTATITGQANLVNPAYCLYNSTGQLVNCNSTGIFSGIAAGAYSITVRDDCYDTTIMRNFTLTQPRPALDANVNIARTGCNTFNAAVTNPLNFTNPVYCLFDAGGNQLSCNGTGSFPGLTNGSYCIRATDACYDTTITRCFTVSPQVPAVAVTVNISGRRCDDFDVSVPGQSNLTNPQFCLYDANGNLVACNSTGNFDDIIYGDYCIRVRNDANCYDTTIVRCFSARPEPPVVGANLGVTRYCSTVDISANGQSNLFNPTYCLYNGTGQLIACNNTGIFTGVAYGSYCMTIANDPDCYDTTIQRCITVTRPQPMAGGAQVLNRTCSTFSASLNWVSNMTNPIYTLTNEGGEVVATGTSGNFNNLPYGSYCISVADTCYDTTITRCVTANPNPVSLNAFAMASCVINSTNVRLSSISGSGPFTAVAYDQEGNVLATNSGSGSTIWLYNLPQLPPGEQYTIELTDNCGSKVTRLVSQVVSTFNRSVSQVQKCPSGTNPAGSAELTVAVSSNLGTVSPLIIRKDGITVNISYNTGSAGTFKWLDLEPATYVIQYNLPGSCSNKLYDTVAVGQYQYPQLDKSASYQCDNNSFSVGANVTGGAPPFTYEIIGSVPASPSILAPPQASPVFSINNGNIYSLVRLRAVDYCGNATLNDVSVLPLQNTVVTASSDCYYSEVVLAADSIPNATYAWYFKTGNDSVLISNERTYRIDYLMPEHIGTYVSRMSVNNGCLVRLNYHDVTGTCNGGLLPGRLQLKGKQQQGDHVLSWNNFRPGETAVFHIERREGSNGAFTGIGQVTASAGANMFSFTDEQPASGHNHYRVKATGRNGRTEYSNTVSLKKQAGQTMHVYPNPVRSELNISIRVKAASRYQVSLYNAAGQLVYATEQHVTGAVTLRINRTAGMRAGMYLLRIRDLGSGMDTTEQVFFE